MEDFKKVATMVPGMPVMPGNVVLHNGAASKIESDENGDPVVVPEKQKRKKRTALETRAVFNEPVANPSIMEMEMLKNENFETARKAFGTASLIHELMAIDDADISVPIALMRDMVSFAGYIYSAYLLLQSSGLISDGKVD